MIEAALTTSAIDTHCHAFDLQMARGPLIPQLTLSAGQLPMQMLRDSILVQTMIIRLAEALGCEPTEDAVEARRAEMLRLGPEGYFSQLLDSAGVESMLCDVGYPLSEEMRPLVEPPRFEGIIGRPCHLIYRIESSAEQLILEDVSFDEFMDVFSRRLIEAIKHGAVSLKSVIAYYSGLDVEFASTKAASRAYDRIVTARRNPEGPFDAQAEKAFWDSLFVTAIQASLEHEIPLQVHTGVGDGPVFDLTTADPALLRRVLIDPSMRGAKIVLTHAGYPWVEHAGWLASQYDNVFVDISEMTPFATVGLKGKIRGLLEMAPISKILFASDGFNTGELHWLATVLFRDSLSELLRDLVQDSWIGQPRAEEAARAILRENAIQLYGSEVAFH